MQYIAFDVHKRYTWARVENKAAQLVRQERILHAPGAFHRFLSRCESRSPVAVETVGNWYWVVDEIERAGCSPKLVNARLAKLMLGQVNKTDKLDARGLNRLQRAGTLPTVWIPSAEIRDLRELPRTRMTLVGQRTQLKNRVHATLAKYGLQPPEVSDLFGKAGRLALAQLIKRLPPNTAQALQAVLGQLDGLEKAIQAVAQRIGEVFDPTPENELLQTLPGVGRILSVVIQAELGKIARFPNAEHLAAYAGTTPRTYASGGKSYGGPTRSDVNCYLKGAFVEAANGALLHGDSYGHVRRLYDRLRTRRATAKQLLPWRGIWRKPPTGYCRNNNLIRSRDGRRGDERATLMEPSSSAF